jgi:hypothetical protein
LAVEPENFDSFAENDMIIKNNEEGDIDESYPDQETRPGDDTSNPNDHYGDDDWSSLKDNNSLSIFLSSLNRIISILNDFSSSSSVNVVEELFCQHELLLLFLLASSELIHLIYENNSFYYHFIKHSSISSTSSHSITSEVKNSLLSLDFMNLDEICLVIVVKLSQTTSLKDLSSEAIKEVPSVLASDIVELSKENLKLFLNEISIHYLLKVNVTSEDKNVSDDIGDDDIVIIAERILLQSFGSDLLHSNWVYTADLEVRKLWNSLMYLCLTFSFLPFNATNKSLPFSSKSRKSSLPLVNLPSYFSEKDHYLELLEDIPNKIQQLHSVWFSTESSSGEAKKNAEDSFLYSFPHLTTCHFHLLSSSTVQSISKKLQDYLKSQYQLFLQQQHKLLSSTISSSSYDARISSSLSSIESIDQILKTYEGCIASSSPSSIEVDICGNGSFSNNGTLSKLFLSSIELDISVEDVSICIAFAAVSKEIRMLKKKSRKKKKLLIECKNGQSLEENSEIEVQNDDEKDEIIKLLKKWKKILFILLSSIVEILSAFVFLDAPSTSSSLSSHYLSSEFLLENENIINELLMKLWKFTLHQSIKLAGIVGNKDDSLLDHSDVKSIFDLSSLILTKLLCLSSSKGLNTDDSSASVSSSSSMTFLILAKQQLTFMNWILQNSSVKTEINDDSSSSTTASSLFYPFLSSCYFYWFKLSASLVSTSDITSSTTSTSDAMVSSFPFESFLILSFFLKYFLCELWKSDYQHCKAFIVDEDEPQENLLSPSPLINVNERNFSTFITKADVEVNLSFLHSLLLVMRGVSSITSDTTTTTGHKELLINCFAMIINIITYQKQIRSSLDSLKAPSLTRMELYRIAFDYLFRNYSSQCINYFNGTIDPSVLSTIFPWINKDSLAATSTKGKKRSSSSPSSSSSLVAEIPSGCIPELIMFQQILFPILYDLMYCSFNRYNLNLSSIKDGYLILGKVFSLLYSFPLSVQSSGNDWFIEDMKEESDDSENGYDDSDGGSDTVASEGFSTEDDSELIGNARKRGRKNRVKLSKSHTISISTTQKKYPLEVILKLYLFGKYGYQIKLLTKNEIRELFYWILKKAQPYLVSPCYRDKKGKQTEETVSPNVFHDYFFHVQMSLVMKSRSPPTLEKSYFTLLFSLFQKIYQIFVNNGVKQNKDEAVGSPKKNHRITFIDLTDLDNTFVPEKPVESYEKEKSFMNEETMLENDNEAQTIEDTSSSTKKELTLTDLNQSIYCDLYELGIILDEENLSKLTKSLFFSNYYFRVEVPQFYSLLHYYPFVKILQDPEELRKIQQEERQNEQDEEESERMDLESTGEEEEDDDEGNEGNHNKKIIEYDDLYLFIDQKVYFYLLLLQKNILSYQVLPASSSSASSSSSSSSTSLFDSYFHLFQYLYDIREKINNFLHERVLYDQTQPYLFSQRQAFFSNEENKTKDYFLALHQVFGSCSSSPSSPSSTSSSHLPNVCYFWPFHSYFLETIMIPYVEAFYIFLASASSSSSSAENSLEKWFVDSKAKEVYLQQLIPSSQKASSSSTSSVISPSATPATVTPLNASSSSSSFPSSVITFNDNIQFIKSILLLDYSLEIFNQFIHQIFVILQSYYCQRTSSSSSTSSSSASSSTRKVDLNESSKTVGTTDEELKLKYGKILTSYCLILQNELNNYPLNDSKRYSLESYLHACYQQGKVFGLFVPVSLRF